MSAAEMNTEDHIRKLAMAVLDSFDIARTEPAEVYGAWFDAGLSWVHFPKTRGGLGAPRSLQAVADDVLLEAGIGLPRLANKIAYGIAAPTLVTYGSPELLDRILRPLATGEEIWCQLFSEPGAGSDLASLATLATPVDGGWKVSGRKVWNSKAHLARWGVLIARTDPSVPKHKGLTYFVVDMHAAGVEVSPLRQMTGEAEFNEVVLDEVFIPDVQRLGEIGAGWKVANTTLANERASMGNRHGGGSSPTPLGDALDLWASMPERHTAVRRDQLAQIWMRAEAHRPNCERLIAKAAVAGPGSEGSVIKLIGAELNQLTYEWCAEFLGPDATLYGSYDDPGQQDGLPSAIMRRFLRSRANTIEGGTAEVLRNIIAERILGLPQDERIDLKLPWRDVRRS